ncbi:MAG: SGNH/GDSL hydrolase family protein [Thermoleophilaceae bacterium]|nr:SGNH/GDSL hydrolase family protein [Thermoleophilaceae bacterium]
MRAVLGIVTLVVVLAVALVGFAFLPEGIQTTLMPPTKDVKPAEYVAIGDSYTAAPELATQIAVSTPATCFQSDSNYPHIVARAIKPSSFTDMSCSGAFVEDLTEPQFTPKGSNHPQDKPLDAKTRLVTIGLSGNDAKILTLFFECAGAPRDPSKPSNCVEMFKTGGKDGFIDAVHATRPLIEGMLTHVEAKAPNAQVFVVGYPQITPNDGTDCPDEMNFTAEDMTYLDTALQELNAQLKDAARRHGMTYVDTYKPSRGFNVCAPRDKRWIESVVPTEPTYAVHPNPVGEQGMAEAVIASIRANYEG